MWNFNDLYIPNYDYTPSAVIYKYSNQVGMMGSNISDMLVLPKNEAYFVRTADIFPATKEVAFLKKPIKLDKVGSSVVAEFDIFTSFGKDVKEAISNLKKDLLLAKEDYEEHVSSLSKMDKKDFKLLTENLIV